MAEQILIRYDATPTAKAFIGAFDSDGVDDEEPTILGVDY
jgi:hypothetical protein